MFNRKFSTSKSPTFHILNVANHLIKYILDNQTRDFRSNSIGHKIHPNQVQNSKKDKKIYQQNAIRAESNPRILKFKREKVAKRNQNGDYIKKRLATKGYK